MTRFIVEFRTLYGDTAKMLPSLNALDAETLPLAKREIEKVLLSGTVDEAILYQPVAMLSAARMVSTKDLTLRPSHDILPDPESP